MSTIGDVYIELSTSPRKMHDLHIMRIDGDKGIAKLFLDGEPLLGVKEMSLRNGVGLGSLTEVTLTMYVAKVTTG